MKVNYPVRRIQFSPTKDIFTINNEREQSVPKETRPLNIAPISKDRVNQRFESETLNEYVNTTILAGTWGLAVKVVCCLLIPISDAILLYVLWRQWDRAQYSYAETNEKFAWILTASISIVPLVVINIISLICFCKRRTDLPGNVRLLGQLSVWQRVLCIISHVFQVGLIFRYLEIVDRPKRKSHDFQKRNMNQSIIDVVRRDMEWLDIAKTCIQEFPQGLLQGYLLVKGSNLFSVRNTDETVLVAQGWRIVLSLFTASWYAASYQDTVRVSYNQSASSGGKAICSWLWKFSDIAARIVAVVAFASLEVNSEGGLLRRSVARSLIPSFASIATFIVCAHFFVMAAISHANDEKTIYKTEKGSANLKSRLPKSLLIGWLNVFCYMDVHRKMKRKDLPFFYLVMLIENSFFVAIVYMQLITVDLWRKVALISTVGILMVISVTCASLYYGYIRSRQTYPASTDVQDMA